MDTKVLEAHFEHLKSSLEDLQACVKDLKKELGLLKVDVAKLNIKSGIWGFAAGFLPVLAGIGLLMLKGLL